MRKLLVIIPALESGGAETFATVIAAASTKTYKVHAAVTTFPALRHVTERLLMNGIRCHTFVLPQEHFTAVREQHRWKNPTDVEGDWFSGLLQMARRNVHRLGELRHTISQYVRTIALLMAVRPDLILLNISWGTFGLGMILACAFSNVPTAVVFHSYPFPFHLRKVKLRAYRWAWNRNQQWIAVCDHSRSLMSETFGIPLERIKRIYTGIQLKPSAQQEVAHTRQAVRAELGIPQQATVLLTVGRLECAKGYQFLIEVLPDLIREFPSLRCVWVGEGEDRLWLQRLAHEHGVADYVMMTGHRSDVSRMMQAADMFVLPSLFEGLPFVLLEAMAQRMPIIASDAGGIPELIHDGVHGVLVRAGDRSSLLQALRRAFANPEQMQAMATAAEQRVREFSQERMIRETLGVLDLLAELREGGRRP